MLASLTTNFRYAVYNASINFGYFWVFWRIFFGYTGIPLPRWPTGQSRGTKQVIRANAGHGAWMWRNIENPDYTFQTSWTNTVTPMKHLLVQAIETKRKLTVNNNRKLQELFLSPSPRSNVVTHIKRTGKALLFFICRTTSLKLFFDQSVSCSLWLQTLPLIRASGIWNLGNLKKC